MGSCLPQAKPAGLFGSFFDRSRLRRSGSGWVGALDAGLGGEVGEGEVGGGKVKEEGLAGDGGKVWGKGGECGGADLGDKGVGALEDGDRLGRVVLPVDRLEGGTGGGVRASGPGCVGKCLYGLHDLRVQVGALGNRT